VQPADGRGLRVALEPLPGGDVGQLLVQVAPFPQAHEGQEMLLHQRRRFRVPAADCSTAARHRFSTATKSERSSANSACAWSAASALSAGRSRGSWMLRNAAITSASARQRWRPPRAGCARGAGRPAARPSAGEARNAPVAVHRAQLLQQAIAVVEQPRVGGIDEREILGRAEPECRHLQDQARQVGAQDFRVGVLRARREVLLGVQAYADPLAHASAATLALLGARPRNRLDRQPLELGARACSG